MTHWQSVNDFFAMGGYGLYVWGSYLVALIFVGLELHALRRRRAQARRTIKKDA